MTVKAFISGNFTFERLKPEGLYLISSRLYPDKRGAFLETYREDDFRAAGIEARFVQDNVSVSKKGVLRGLHFQAKHPQAKLVRVLRGAIFDVAVDLRAGSPTRGTCTGVILSAENALQIYIPKGFAHGFLTLSDEAVCAYKCDAFYDPEDQSGIFWNDPALQINWPAPDGWSNFDTSRVITNDRDAKWPRFA